MTQTITTARGKSGNGRPHSLSQK